MPELAFGTSLQTLASSMVAALYQVLADLTMRATVLEVRGSPEALSTLGELVRVKVRRHHFTSRRPPPLSHRYSHAASGTATHTPPLFTPRRRHTRSPTRVDAAPPALPTPSPSQIVLGAGVRPDGRCLVRFFGIFSTPGISGGSTYSCNVSATGRRRADGSVEILALLCAKDEGWSRTIDLKQEA